MGLDLWASPDSILSDLNSKTLNDSIIKWLLLDYLSQLVGFLDKTLRSSTSAYRMSSACQEFG